MENQDPTLWLMKPEKWDAELLIFTKQQQQHPVPGFHALGSGSHPHSQTVNSSDPFPLFFQADQLKFAETTAKEVTLNEIVHCIVVYVYQCLK